MLLYLNITDQLSNTILLLYMHSLNVQVNHVSKNVPTNQVRQDDILGGLSIGQCMVPQNFNLRPHLLKSIVHVIRYITNRKYAFYCVN